MSALAATSVAPLYAGFWRRAAASLLDGLILAIPNVIINLVMSNHVLQLLVTIIVGCAYYAGFHSSSSQATPGKMAFGIKVTDRDGGRINLGRAIGRYFAAWLSIIILGIGFLLAAFTQKRQALHDMICNTLVVNRSAQPNEIVAGGGVMPVTSGVWVCVIILFVLPFLGGIVAAIAIPAYRDYTIRARVSEAILATSQCRTAVARIYSSGTAAMTANNWGCGEDPVGPVTQYAQTITTNVNGVITVQTQNVTSLGAAADKTLTLTPVDTAGVAMTYSAPSSTQVAKFKCVGLTMVPKYMPGSCR